MRLTTYKGFIKFNLKLPETNLKGTSITPDGIKKKPLQELTLMVLHITDCVQNILRHVDIGVGYSSTGIPVITG